jgi:hypothetical protein
LPGDLIHGTHGDGWMGQGCLRCDWYGQGHEEHNATRTDQSNTHSRPFLGKLEGIMTSRALRGSRVSTPHCVSACQAPSRDPFPACAPLRSEPPPAKPRFGALPDGAGPRVPHPGPRPCASRPKAAWGTPTHRQTAAAGKANGKIYLERKTFPCEASRRGEATIRGGREENTGLGPLSL